MNKFIYRTPVKVLSLVLFFVFTILSITAGVFAAEFYTSGMQNYENFSHYKEEFLAQRKTDVIHNDANSVLGNFEQSGGNVQQAMLYNPVENIGAYFTITVDGQNMGGTYSDQEYLEQHSYTRSMFLDAYPVGTTIEFDSAIIHPDDLDMLVGQQLSDEITYYKTEDGIYYLAGQKLRGVNGEQFVVVDDGLLSVLESDAQYGEVTVDLYYTENIVYDYYYTDSLTMASIAYTYGAFGTPVAVASGVLAIVCLVLCLASVGRKYGVEGVHLSSFDKLPLEIPLIGVAIALSVAPWGGIESLIAIVILFILGTTSFISILVRIKAGGWWKNTIIYRVINFFRDRMGFVWNTLKSESMKTPLAVRCTALVIGLSVLMLMVFAVNGYYEGDNMLIMGLLCLAVLGGLLILIAVWMGQLTRQAKAIAGGNFGHKIDTSNMRFDFAQLGEILGGLGNSINFATEQRMKSERMKTQLITNVSHDIKTPLTSIINYVDLLSKEECDNPKVGEYCEILDRQSQKLKHLLEDLVEASRLSSGSVEVNLSSTDLVVLAGQIQGEYQDKLQAKGLELVLHTPDEPCQVMADSRHLQRVFDNLLDNVQKYALEGTRVYLDVTKIDDVCRITLKNTSKEQLNITADELMERFVRGDGARNSEGNGLGLSIAQSLARVQGAELNITVDGDLFKAEAVFRGN